MPNIKEMLLKLEGFQYAMLFDLDMAYYHIQLSENASNLCKIIIPWKNIVTKLQIHQKFSNRK